MRVADGASQRVRRVGRGRCWELQQPLDHLLHLFLGRMTIAHHRLFYLQRGVFRHLQIGGDGGANRRAACLSEQQGGFRIDVDKHLFHRHVLGLMLLDDFGEAVENGFEPLRQCRIRRFDTAAGDVSELVPGLVDDAKSGNA